MINAFTINLKGVDLYFLLYADYILLASNGINLLLEMKSFLLLNFEIKDFEDIFFVISIQIQRDRTRRILGLSKKAYIDKVLDKYGINNCSQGDTSVIKGDKLSLL